MIHYRMLRDIANTALSMRLCSSCEQALTNGDDRDACDICIVIFAARAIPGALDDCVNFVRTIGSPDPLWAAAIKHSSDCLETHVNS